MSYELTLYRQPITYFFIFYGAHFTTYFITKSVKCLSLSEENNIYIGCRGLPYI